jgi:hypothetical protein
MIKIAISQAAFDAIAATLPLGSVGYENGVKERGERLIWLDPGVVSRVARHARARRKLPRCDFAAGVGKCRLRD